MYNIIPLIVILVCLAVIVAIVVKKFPLLASFDISSISKEKETETKTKIMEERLQRKLKFWASKMKPFADKIKGNLHNQYSSAQLQLKKLEEKYRQKVSKDVLVTKEEFESLEKRMERLLKSAQDLSDQEKYDDAEKKYIEVISNDPRNIEAYRGLGNLYFLQKNYEDAKQTFKHILKLDKLDDLAYANLGKIALEKGEYKDAKDHFTQSLQATVRSIHFFELAEVCLKMEEYQEAIINLEKALELEPNNPKYLDLLIAVSILVKDKSLAKEALARLQEVNPENKKIEEFLAEIRSI